MKRNKKTVAGACATRKALAEKPLTCILLGLALAGVFLPLAASGESDPRRCVAVSSAGLIDARTAAVAVDAVIVVETRARHTVATPAATIDTERGTGVLIYIR